MAGNNRAIQTISYDRFSQLAKGYEAMKKKAVAVKDNMEKTVEHATHTAEIGAVSYALGASRGYFGPVELMGIPLELGVAVAAHGGAILLGDSKASPHLRAAGDAAVGAFGFMSGLEAGRAWFKKSGKTPTAKQKEQQDRISGDEAAGSVGGLTPEERAAVGADTDD